MIGQFSLGFDGKNAAHYEVIFATGDEIEMVAANQLSQTRVTGAAVFGSFPVTERLFLHWRLMTHKQGSFYRRIGLGVGVSGGF
jgi:YaiO family outer membrane protein